MLVPTVGTAAIIIGSMTPSPVRAILRWRPVVFVGLIGYRAYLWHQPMFAFANYLYPLSQATWLPPVLVASTMVLAFLTWKFVEQPWRNREKFPRRAVFVTAAAGTTLFIAAGLGLKLTKGIPEKLAAPVLAITNEVSEHEQLRDDGGCSRNRDQHALADCIEGAAVPPRIAIVGDSHATSLVPALESTLRARGESFIQYTKLGCPFSINVDTTDNFRCADFWENVFADIEHREIDTVLVVSRWSYYLQDTGFNNRQGGVEPHSGKRYSVDGLSYDAPIESRAKAVLDAYLSAIKRLDQPDRHVFVMLPLPEQGWDVARLLARMATSAPDFKPTADAIPPLPRSLWLARHADVLREFQQFESHSRIHLFDPTPALCPLDNGNGCPAVLEGSALFYDDDHPTVIGAARVVQPFLASVFAASKQQAEVALLAH